MNYLSSPNMIFTFDGAAFPVSSWGSERPEKEPVALSQWRTGGSPGASKDLPRIQIVPSAMGTILSAQNVIPTKAEGRVEGSEGSVSTVCYSAKQKVT